ncbi:hypothetical protein AAMO2058_001208800 [Amorphochlora amoebiformis]
MAAGFADGEAPSVNQVVGFLYSKNTDRIIFSDYAAHTIRELDYTLPSTNLIIGLPNNPGFDGQADEARFRQPRGLAWTDIQETGIYICDEGNNRIRRYNLSSINKEAETVAGSGEMFKMADGQGISASFLGPRAMVIDEAFEFAYVADAISIRKMHLGTYETTRIAGANLGLNDRKSDGVGMNAGFDSIQDMVYTQDYLYVVDLRTGGTGGGRIRRIDLNTTEVITLAGNTTKEGGYKDGLKTNALFDDPLGIVSPVTSGPGTVLYVMDTGNDVIRSVDVLTGEVNTIVGDHTGRGLSDGIGRNANISSPLGALWVNDSETLFIGEGSSGSSSGHSIRMIYNPTLSPTTTTPSVSPTTTSPQTKLPTSHSPSSSSPQSQAPQTTSPTSNPSSSSPSSSSPSSSSPSSSSPRSSSPSTLSPLTPAPSTSSPSSSFPFTRAPTSLFPTSFSPISFQPTSNSPKSIQPTSSSPYSLHPTSNSPKSIGPTTSPVTRVPVTLIPVTSTPVTLGPTSSSPATCQPVTITPTSSPVTRRPVTITPTSSSPVTCRPVTITPTSSFPTCSPSKAVTGSPVTRVPTSAGPTGTPITGSPVTVRPTSSPATLNPNTVHPVTLTPNTLTPTRAPSEPVGQGFYFSKGFVTLTEGNPSWAKTPSGNQISTRFFVQNLRPQTQSLRVSCSGNNMLSVTPSVVTLGGFEPTTYTCRIDGNITVVECNRQPLMRTTKIVSQCTHDQLVASMILEIPEGGRRFPCPNPCYDTLDGCGDTENGRSAVGVFEIRALFNPQIFDFNSEVRCMVSNEDQVTDNAPEPFSVQVTVRDVVWPAMQEFLIQDPSDPKNYFKSNDENGDFVVSLSGVTRVIAVASTPLAGAFSNANGLCPNITVGGIPAVVETCNRENVTFLTPSFRELCGNVSSESCGYQEVAIVNPDGLTSVESKGGRVNCPGDCPIGGLGFYYTSTCAGFSPPIQCAQLDPNNHKSCAYGSGDSCSPCPSNAYCPGGERVWPREGYWTASETAGTVIECPPDPLLRCIGWDVSESQTRCGVGYGGILCAGCAVSYYERLQECVACPGGFEGFMRIILLLVVAVGVFLIAYGCVRASLRFKSPKSHKRNLTPSARKSLVKWQAKDFAIWTVLVLQLFSLTISSAGALAPETVTFFSWMKILSLNFEAVGPECISSGPAFLAQKVILPVTLTAAATVLALSRINKTLYLRDRYLKHYQKRMNTARGYLYTFLISTYTPSTFLSIAAIHCIPSTNSNGDDTWVSWANPNYECLGNQHTSILALGILVLFFHAILFPIWSLWKMQAVYYSAEKKKKIAASHYKKFFGDDYQPKYFYFLHIRLSVAFILCCTSVFFSAYNDASQGLKFSINIFVLAGFSSLLLYTRPHVTHMEWKLYVQVSLSILLSMTTIMELMNYLYLHNQTVERKTVADFSIFVLALAIANFLVLAIAFYHVVWVATDHSHFKSHFLLQRKYIEDSTPTPTPSRQGSERAIYLPARKTTSTLPSVATNDSKIRVLREISGNSRIAVGGESKNVGGFGVSSLTLRRVSDLCPESSYQSSKQILQNTTAGLPVPAIGSPSDPQNLRLSDEKSGGTGSIDQLGPLRENTTNVRKLAKRASKRFLKPVLEFQTTESSVGSDSNAVAIGSLICRSSLMSRSSPALGLSVGNVPRNSAGRLRRTGSAGTMVENSRPGPRMSVSTGCASSPQLNPFSDPHRNQPVESSPDVEADLEGDVGEGYSIDTI